MADTELWRRARDLFWELADHPTQEQERLLAEHTKDPALSKAVRSLLAEDSATDGFLAAPLDFPSRLRLDEPALTDLAGGSLSGTELGGCRLIRELGRGGSGVVYLGERRGEGFVQRVAVKVLDRPLDRETAARMRRERRILAALEHPGIARLIDGGTTPAGVPFVVMELVDGVPITRHCESKRLGVEERLRLFLRTCDAVQHAHRNLIVHRDLKPANLLVTEAGELKLLDFGIAKLLAGSWLQRDGEPKTRGRWLSPGYASPEQVLGHPVTTTSDVYSLGVLLHELLTGHRPAHSEPAVWENPAVWPEPLAPSSAVRQATGSVPIRGLGRRQLARRLRGDLDRIVLRALTADPRRRYGSVEALGADLRRHLAHQPVAARRGGRFYRLGRFTRRHPVGVTIGAALAAAAVLFSLLSARQATRLATEKEAAERQRSSAEAVSEILIGVLEVMEPSGEQPYSVAARAALAEGRQRILRRFENDPKLRAPLLSKVGQVYLELGFFAEAEELLRQAVSQEGGQEGERGGVDDAELAAIEVQLGRVLAVRGSEEAVPLLRGALDRLRTPYGAEHPEVAEALARLASALRFQGQLEEAQERAIEAVAIDRHLGTTGKRALERRRILAGVVAVKGDLHRARELFSELLGLYRAELGERSLEAGLTLNSLAAIAINQGLFAEAHEPATEALEILGQRLDANHPQVGIAHSNLATSLFRAFGDLAAAEVHYRRALDINLAQVGREHPWVGGDYYMLGLLKRELGKPSEAVELLRQSLEIRHRVLPDSDPQVHSSHNELGAALRDLGLLEEAERHHREALAEQQGSAEGGSWRRAESWASLAQVALARGRAEKARRLAARTQTILAEPGLPERYRWLRSLAASVEGAALARLGLREQAERLLLPSAKEICAEFGPWSVLSRQAAERVVDLFEGDGRGAEAAAWKPLLTAVGRPPWPPCPGTEGGSPTQKLR